MSLFNIKNYENSYYEKDFQSTCVECYTYDSINLTLLVKFSDNSLYLYSGVPISIADRFAITPSKGSFIYHNLKGYPYKKIST